MFQQYFDELSTVLSEADGKLGEATNPLHSDGDGKVALLKEVGGLLSAGGRSKSLQPSRTFRAESVFLDLSEAIVADI